MRGDAATYYDRLSTWTRVARWFGYGGGYDTGTVHRLLLDPAAGGRPTATRLHDILAETMPAIPAPRVLDAGCGLGGTMRDLATRWGGQYTGLTLSETQAAIGLRALAEAGLADRVRVHVQSYDQPPAGPFDRIIAIESLAHSADPARSVGALSQQLAAGGLFAIVDDMPMVSVAAAGAGRDLATFKRGWQCPVLFSREQFVAALAANGLDVIVDRDLSDAYQPRPLARIAWLAAINRAARVLLPSAGVRAMLDSYLGGLALERLYHGRHMTYRLLVAQRPSGPSSSTP